jgi:hypothetical protein
MNQEDPLLFFYDGICEYSPKTYIDKCSYIGGIQILRANMILLQYNRGETGMVRDIITSLRSVKGRS